MSEEDNKPSTSKKDNKVEKAIEKALPPRISITGLAESVRHVNGRYEYVLKDATIYEGEIPIATNEDVKISVDRCENADTDGNNNPKPSGPPKLNFILKRRVEILDHHKKRRFAIIDYYDDDRKYLNLNSN